MLRPGDAGLQSNLAVALAGQIDDAVTTVEAAIEADPTDKIIRALKARTVEVRDRRLPAPRTLADLEGCP